tara:strand:+ start:3604 stop:4446 length:843 start_codon:yes stop_codon:yes gene_type:complete
MENLKLGILGLDSTHFDAFLEIFRNENIQLDLVFLRDDSSKVIERRISEYPELEDLFSEEPSICDCFMIMNRFGDDHIRSFKEIARFGKPTFIDKPIASSLQEAIEISKIAKEFNTPITSHSPLEFSKEFNEIKVTYRKMIESKEKSILIFSGPAECNDIGDDPRFKSPLFYGIHLSEMLSNICSDDLKKETPIHLDNRYILPFKSGLNDIFIDLYKNGPEFYCISIYNNKLGFKSYEINLNGSYYTDYVEFLLKFFKNDVETEFSKKSLRALSFLDEVI